MGTKRANGEGTIGQYKGRWIGRVTLPDGRRKALYGKTRAEVARKVAAVIRDRDAGLPTAPETITVGTYLAEWLAESVKPNNRPSTYSSYESHVRLHLTPSIGTVRLARLTPRHVEALFARKLDEGLSASTVNRIRATLRRALNRALKQGLVQRNVAALADAPTPSRKIVEPLTQDQAATLLRHIEGHRLEPLIVLALATGLRQGELLGLQWPDVDLDAGRLTVRTALQRINGEYVFVEPKTDRSRRTLPIPSAALASLKKHRVAQDRLRQTAGDEWQGLDLVFTTTSGRPYDGPNVTRAFQRLVEGAGLPRMRFHDLRHACASFLLAQGASMRVVMEQLGHSQISMTMNTYSHVMPEALEEAADLMDRVISVS